MAFNSRKSLIMLISVILLVFLPFVFLFILSAYSIKISLSWFKRFQKVKKMRRSIESIRGNFKSFDLSVEDCVNSLTLVNRSDLKQLSLARDNLSMALCYLSLSKFGDTSRSAANDLVVQKLLSKHLKKSFVIRDKDSYLCVRQAILLLNFVDEDPMDELVHWDIR